jgi:hypothetical protein
VVIQLCTFLTFPFRSFRFYYLSKVCRVDEGERIGQVAQFLVRQVAYLRKSGGGLASEISAEAVVCTPPGVFAPVWWRMSCWFFASPPSLLEGMEAPPGDPLPRPVRGRL